MNPEIVIYWGAFDPPQLAHEAIAREVVEKIWPEKLYIVPSWPHPFKTYKTKEEYRRRISEIFVENIDSPKIELCTDFIDGMIPNTTLNTDRYFTEKLWIRPYQIFGSDLIESFWKWDPTWEVAMYLPKIIIKRPWYEIDYSRIANFIIFDPFWNSEVAMLSSTEVREWIQKWVYRWINPEIASYIEENALYL